MKQPTIFVLQLVWMSHVLSVAPSALASTHTDDAASENTAEVAPEKKAQDGDEAGNVLRALSPTDALVRGLDGSGFSERQLQDVLAGVANVPVLSSQEWNRILESVKSATPEQRQKLSKLVEREIGDLTGRERIKPVRDALQKVIAKKRTGGTNAKPKKAVEADPEQDFSPEARAKDLEEKRSRLRQLKEKKPEDEKETAKKDKDKASGSDKDDLSSMWNLLAGGKKSGGDGKDQKDGKQEGKDGGHGGGSPQGGSNGGGPQAGGGQSQQPPQQTPQGGPRGGQPPSSQSQSPPPGGNNSRNSGNNPSSPEASPAASGGGSSASKGAENAAGETKSKKEDSEPKKRAEKTEPTKPEPATPKPPPDGLDNAQKALLNAKPQGPQMAGSKTALNGLPGPAPINPALIDAVTGNTMPGRPGLGGVQRTSSLSGEVFSGALGTRGGAPLNPMEAGLNRPAMGPLYTTSPGSFEGGIDPKTGLPLTLLPGAAGMSMQLPGAPPVPPQPEGLLQQMVGNWGAAMCGNSSVAGDVGICSGL